MHCRSCGADLPADAAFCSQCGARVELGSVLGVGTDLPAMPRRDQPIAEPEPEHRSGHQPEPAEDLSQTRELPRVDPTAAPPADAAHEGTQPMVPVPARAPSPGRHEAPAAPVTAPVAHHEPVAHEPVAPYGHRAPDNHDGLGDHDDRPGHSRNSVLAMIATFAVLTIIGTFALTRLVGSDDPQPTTASSSSASGAEETGDASAAPSPSASGSDAKGASPSASASSSVPAGARRCSTSGNDSVATAYAGSERTSCEFAAAVREAYRKAGTPEGATSLRAYSPVTKKWYSLSCDGGEPVRCTSTTNAIVLLAP
ncbi:zinc-ribbon domain-containing protein [Knoellia sp. LjRoot47]|uniref:zinc ribbon domain-containing protein n=1 Tax=Knoellia sp. LjRoot47 TaxID=3342330 RepID=UPI003ED02FD3